MSPGRASVAAGCADNLEASDGAELGPVPGSQYSVTHAHVSDLLAGAAALDREDGAPDLGVRVADGLRQQLPHSVDQLLDPTPVIAEPK